MSRPQFQTPTTQAASGLLAGHVVNGGLIDFQDNFHRGLPDYCSLMAVQNGQQPLLAGVGMQGYPMPSPLQQSFQQAPYQAVASAMGGVAQQQTTILGHPSFINVAGKMYKPVEEPAAHPSMQSSDHGKQEPETVAPARITDKDIDRRVQQRLQEWVSSQKERPFVRKGKTASSDEERAAARVKSVNAGMRKGYFSPA